MTVPEGAVKCDGSIRHLKAVPHKGKAKLHILANMANATVCHVFAGTTPLAGDVAFRPTTRMSHKQHSSDEKCESSVFVDACGKPKSQETNKTCTPLLIRMYLGLELAWQAHLYQKYIQS